MITKHADGGVTTPKGFKAASYTAGFKPSGAPDLALIATADASPATAAAAFTKNLVRAAPIDVSEANMVQSDNKVVAILINSGQANAATGEAGHADAVETTQLAASALSCQPHHIFLCSTGIIGRPIDMTKMRPAIPSIVNKVSDSQIDGLNAALAICTTDLVHKQVAYSEQIAGSTVTIGGMCKGSGMIHPEMATMLGVVTCDADVEPTLWQAMLKRAVDKSFNVITVDGDTSTNDVVCALAGGASNVKISDPSSTEAQKLEELLTETCIHLAKSIARDGEGATVLLEVNVSGAASDQDARDIARTVASSSLTKSAIFGRDPNWGRIAGAAGRAKANFDPTDLRICMGEHVLMDKGTPLSFDAKAASKYMADKANAAKEDYLSDKDTVVISIAVGNGPGRGVAWGCDLSYKYVEINAEYTT